MAEGEAGRRSPLSRSASCKRFERWIGPEERAGGGGGGGIGGPRGEREAAGAQPCQGQPPSARAQQQQPPGQPIGRRSPSRAASFSVSRSVAKLSSSSSPSPGPDPAPPTPLPGGRALRSLSPSVRQLSRRFCAPQGEPGAGRGTSTCAAGAREDQPSARPADETPAAVEQPPPPPPPRGKGLSEPPKGGGAAALDWPSVTEMRKLFGDGFRRQQQGGPRGDPVEEGAPQDQAGELGHHLPGGMDGAPRLLPDGAAPGRREFEERPRVSSEQRREAPPTPPPRSCIPFRTHRLPPRTEAQPPQLRETLHSWHSWTLLPAASSSSSSSSSSSPAVLLLGEGGSSSFRPGEISSSEEELMAARPKGPPQLASCSPPGGNGWHGSPHERSSGSEEENRLAAPRKRSLRKKKKDPLPPKQASGSDGLAAGMEWYLKAQEDLAQTLSLPAEERTRPSPEIKAPATASLLGEAKAAGEGPVLVGRTLLEGGGGSSSLLGTQGPLSSAPTLPLVSRVSKVNIPPFSPSPCGSRSSSRYSSTETLKEEDHFGASWPGQGRASQAGPGLFRSPSFNQSDSLARLQAQVRARPKFPSGIARAKQDFPTYENLEAAERSRNRKSMSNPDIATETLALLSFLKSDLWELKAGRKGGRASQLEEEEQEALSSDRCRGSQYGLAGQQLIGRTQSETQPPNRWAPGSSRPTLKDLTATLRRAKSFTYSDKPAPRRLFHQSAMKQSSSELLLTDAGNQDAVCGREIGRGGEDGESPVVIQDQYIQEARQVFEKIRKIGSQHDYSFGLDQKDVGSTGGEGEISETWKKGAVEEQGQGLREVDSEGNLSGGKSLEELSGPESSMTDEGIVTEPETGPAYSYLNPSVAAWKHQRGSEGGLSTVSLPNHSAKANSEKLAAAEEVLPNAKTALEAPSTPGALRRRRKFPSVGNGASDSSSGSNGESNGESYRSLSDPMPHRRCSLTDDANNFSVDSNLLGSLSSKPGMPEASPVALSECTASAASDLSVCSEGAKDYSAVIQNIVSQPGALDKVIDEKGNGKTIKKKSFSDPSRRGELAGAGFDGPGEPISEMDQSIPPSSSEPILSEQVREADGGELYSQSELILPAAPEGDTGDMAPSYGFDPKLAEVLSPRIVRRSSKKRSNRASSQEGKVEEPDLPPAATPSSLGRARPPSKHTRHASEPATFIPIAGAHPPPPLSQNIHGATPDLSRLLTKPYPVLQTPSLEDVTKHYILALGSGESPSATSVDTSRSSPATLTTSEPKLPRCPKHHEEPGAGLARRKPQVDMRKHVIMTLLDTEQSYVESLRTLMQGYMKPLKLPENAILCDPALVDEIFDQIPELLDHHEEFLEQITECVQSWSEKQKVGDILVQSFSKDILVNIYSAYIDNFLNAKDAVRIAKEARPAFMKFLEQSMRENKEKQALSDLMIKPVQRIPRYELLVKDLLKHTPESHPDHPFLMEAQRSIKQVAERINKGMRSAEEVERNARIVQEIESHIEGMEDLQAPLRRFLRQEMLVEVKAVGGKKDRSLFLFTDLLVCTTLKRKSGSLRRSSMSLYTAASVIDTASKYKLLWKFPLEDLDIVKGASQSPNRESIQKAITRLDEDLSTLGQVSKLSETLSFPHQSLDDVIKDLMAAIHRELAEKQSLSFTLSFPPNKMEMTASKADGTESYIFEFPNPDARHSFEQAFEDTKKKLASYKNCLDPEFLKAIPIMKTRSGMQFSCASPSHSNPENAYEVWVCNSDGYVGQVCLLSVKKEPIVEACIAVCSARILCIASVPGLKRIFRECPEPLTSPSSELVHTSMDEPGPQQCLHISISGSSLELSDPVDSTNRELVPFDSDDTDDESSPSPSGTLQSQASHSTISSSFGNEEIPSSKDATAETTSSEEEQDPAGFLPIATTFAQNSDSPMDGRALRRSSRGSFTRGSLEDLLSINPEAYQSSMWLGTEDGCIHVYQSSDNIRNRKNSMKMQHSASVTCILYLDNQVFVSLANGELIAYQREAGRFWDSQNSKSLSLGSPGSPVTKMVAVGGKLWCGCQNRVVILSTSSLQQEHSFHVGQDSNRSLTCMVSSSAGVWVTLQGSAQVRLYHPSSYDQLAEVDVTPPVHKMLAGSDAIIRQHKAACLRITAILACKDLLWIGTSAGVVLTLPMTSNAASLKTPPLPVGLSQGHTGHVRFLTSIELPEGFDLLFPLPRDPGTEKSNDLEKRDSTRHRPPKSKMLIISGGDGYEDFRLTNSSETVGRDDSTNHLLLWRV